MGGLVGNSKHAWWYKSCAN